jgi:hypothetical protein
MADQPHLEVQGLGQLVRTLRRAGDDVGDLKDAHARVAAIVAAAGASRAPRRSGALASSVRGSRQVRRARVSAGRASVPYAGVIHWGWPAHNIAPNPFLSEAAQDTESQWTATYQRDVQHVLDKVKGA